MTTTTEFKFTVVGESYAGTPLYRVETPSGIVLGLVACSPGKRGDTWMARGLDDLSEYGFRSRHDAALSIERKSR